MYVHTVRCNGRGINSYNKLNIIYGIVAVESKRERDRGDAREVEAVAAVVKVSGSGFFVFRPVFSP